MGEYSLAERPNCTLTYRLHANDSSGNDLLRLLLNRAGWVEERESQGGNDWAVRSEATDAAINTLLAEGHPMAAVGDWLGISAATVCRRAAMAQG
jgi:hypothetical protein